MKTIHGSPEFLSLTEDEINKALDAFEDQFPDDGDMDPDYESQDPIVNEVARLIAAYSDKLDEICGADDDWLSHVMEYQPAFAIESVAYDIFRDALEDQLDEMDFSDGEEDD